jgi:hypothetical protein
MHPAPASSTPDPALDRPGRPPAASERVRRPVFNLEVSATFLGKGCGKADISAGASRASRARTCPAAGSPEPARYDGSSRPAGGCHDAETPGAGGPGGMAREKPAVAQVRQRHGRLSEESCLQESSPGIDSRACRGEGKAAARGHQSPPRIPETNNLPCSKPAGNHTRPWRRAMPCERRRAPGKSPVPSAISNPARSRRRRPLAASGAVALRRRLQGGRVRQHVQGEPPPPGRCPRRRP